MSTPKRRPFSAPAGALHAAGPPEASERLARALTAPPLPAQVPEEERGLVESALSVHLFHSFAARSHPLTVRLLLSEVGPGQVVFDPFVGSGTVLIEAMLRGARALGQDLGELQVRLARFKATPMAPAMREALFGRARAVSEASLARVRARQRPGRTWDQARHYEPHVYLELCGLREEIAQVAAEDPPLSEGLLLCLSAILIKVSRQRAESSPEEVRKRLAKGYVSRLFLAKAAEAMRLHQAYAERLSSPWPPPPRVWQGDARLPPRDVAPGSVDVVVTSPPYPGVYDYVVHHERRCAFLEIDIAGLQQREIGARRTGHQAGLRRYQEDTRAWLGQVARVLRAGGVAYVLIGDGELSGKPVRGDEVVRAAAEAVGLRSVASCSVVRPLRREHLLELQKP